ncbi:MAG: CRP-like cAMP-binding protein, partial [Gammaproteobacteria bacterium]
ADELTLLNAALQRRYADGETIVREGERAQSLFILRSGTARVERSHGEFSVEISLLNKGEIFGEMGFVEEFAASASVIAAGDCEVDLLREEIVQGAMNLDPGFAGRFFHSIAYILSRRLRATSVEALSEFSWGTGSFARTEQEASAETEQVTNWGGGSPLRDEP